MITDGQNVSARTVKPVGGTASDGTFYIVSATSANLFLLE